MTSEQAEFLSCIESFDIDGADGVALPFAARLARENGWSRAYADRAIAEYKRYVFLAVIRGQPVCPSEDVDAAWHLHLTYTKSYWQRFCGEVLSRPLHHEPTKGGPAEAGKHLAMYAETLAAYREAFGHEPPVDVWPPAGARFGDDLRHRVVNTARNWVIPKGPVKRAARLAVLFAAVAAFVPGCNGGFDPFALKGTDFLYFLVPMLVAAVCIGRVIRSNFHGPAPREEDEHPDLGREQIAYLSGGSARLTTAAIARLAGNGVAAVEGKRLVRGGRRPTDATAVEQAVLHALPFSNEPTSLKPVAQAVETAFGDEAKKLEADGYLLSTLTRFGAVCASLVPLLLVLLVFVLPRFVGAAARGKPVEYLAFTTIVGTLFSLSLIFYGYARLTRRGEFVLARLQTRNAELKTGAAWGGRIYDSGLAVALFGTAVLVGSSVAVLHAWYPRQTSGDAGGGCGTGGCGAGGTGGGCGGCGGGGCGGGGD